MTVTILTKYLFYCRLKYVSLNYLVMITLHWSSSFSLLLYNVNSTAFSVCTTELLYQIMSVYKKIISLTEILNVP